MSTHTPGPWVTDDVYQDDIARYVMSDLLPFPHTIARLELGQDRAEQEANARLIAAAPDLLEACKLIVSALDAVRPASAVRNEWLQINVARAAIAKATGGAA